MPVRKIRIPPGIDRQSTSQSNDGSWYEGNNVRWEDSDTQTIGGWVSDGMYTLEGIGRGLHAWTDFSGNQYQVVGTTDKFYIVAGTSTFDITPVRDSYTGGANFLTTGDINTGEVKVTDADHGASVGDFVVFDLVTSTIDGITKAEFESELGGYKIYKVDDVDNYWVKITGASCTVGGVGPGGGLTDIHYKIKSGSSADVTGQGFGTGPWGGDDFLPDPFALATPYVTATTGTNKILFGNNGSFPAAVGDWIYPYDLVGTAGSLDVTYLNNKWWEVTNAPGGDAEIDAPFTITATGNNAAGGVGNFFIYDASATPPSVEGATRGWGKGSEESVITSSMRTVSISNFGEDLMFSNRGGPIYYFDISEGTTLGVPIEKKYGVTLLSIGTPDFVSQPTVIDSFIVSEGQGHTIAFGCNDIGSSKQNRMLIRWSERHNPFEWLPSPSNEAGGEVLRHGSTIVQAVSTKEEIIIFTDSATYSMRYVGYPEVYGVKIVGSNTTIASRNAAVAVDSNVYFMGDGQFYMYNGTVKTLSKNISSFVFNNINRDQIEKVFCGTNSQFSEVIWFYPDGDSFEPNRYVAYDYSLGTWSTGAMDMLSISSSDNTDTDARTYNRTAWQDTGVFDHPLASYIYQVDHSTEPEILLSSIFNHEIGTSADSRPINYSIKSGEVDIDDGDRYAFYDKIIPDITAFNVTEANAGEVTMSIQGRNIPGRDEVDPTSITVDFNPDPVTGLAYSPDFNETSVRGRARSISIEIASDTTGFGWRLGDIRVRFRPDGRD